MKLASIITLGTLVAWALLAIFDMWFDIVSWSTFVKITVTLGLLAVVAVGIALVKREYMDDKKLKKDKYID